MERNQFWIFLGIGLAVGLCLEVMKSPANKGKVRLAGFTRFETLLDEGREVYVPEEKSAAARPTKSGKSNAKKQEEPIIPHQLSAEELPPSMPIGDVPAAPAVSGVPTPPPPRPESPEEKKRREHAVKVAKQKAQEAKQQAEEKTRKEAEQAKADAERVEKEEKEQAEAEEQAKKKASEELAQQQEPPPPASPAEMPDAEPTNPAGKAASATDWEAYISRGKDVSRVQRFLKAYREGGVSPQVYYAVLRNMLKNKRPELHQWAVFALGQTPSRTSFGLLATSASSDTDSTARSQAATFVNNYAVLGNLRYLAEVINSESNPATVLAALHVVKTAATQYLSGTPPPPQPTAQGRGQQVSAQALVGYFQPIVAALTIASRANRDQQVRTEAAQELTQLQAQLAQLGHGQQH